ncbi:unnamed protein product [Cunninghamella blakesleeana]
MKLLTFINAFLCTTMVFCQTQNRKNVIGYFPNWLYENYPITRIPFNKYTHINYAFALQNKEGGEPHFEDDWAVENYLPKIVESAHKVDTKVLLSIGGWSGSQKFSSMVASSKQRQKFIQWNLNFIQKYKTDGVDIDWEYPSKQGTGCNQVNKMDTDHFLLLLKELRMALDQFFPKDYKLITMAVHAQPFINENGMPSSDVSSFVPYFDFINIMTYDINGAWAEITGPNAPFEAEANKSSYVQSIHAWKNAGIPKEKINAGLAFYGRSMQAKSDMTITKSQYQEAIKGAPQGDSDDTYWTNPSCSNDVQGYSGIWKWSNLRSQGLISNNDKSTTTNHLNWIRFWDNVSKTPWLFNPNSKTFISYDDPESLSIKVEHALCEDIAGVMIWDIHQDYNNELINAVSQINSESFKCIHSATFRNDKSRKFEQIQSYPKSPLSNIPSEGTKCNLSQKSTCIQSGISNHWLTCDTNRWMIRECPKDLTCHDTNDGILCDYTMEEKFFIRFQQQLQKWKDILKHLAFPTEQPTDEKL